MKTSSFQPTSSILSFSRLPTELWAIIFKIFYDSFHVIENPRRGPCSLHPTHPLQVITNVCHTWRNIIESLPALWTKIMLKDCWKVPKKGISTYLPSKLCILANILRNSRDLPLQIIISAALDANPSALVCPFMLYIAEHSHRWTRLIIDENEDISVFGALNSAISLLGIEELPSLESVSVDWRLLRGSNSNNIDYSELYNVKLPKLSKLCMAYRCIPQLVPLDDLKEVEFNNFPVAERWAALRSGALSSVEAIFVTGDEVDSTPFGSNASTYPYTLAALERLCVRDWELSGFAPMITSKLQELIIDGMARVEEMRSIILFIKRSGCLLATFIVKCIFADVDVSETDADLDNATIALIPCLPAVKTLHLGLPDQNIEALANALSQTKDGRWCNCFSLEHLTFGYLYDPECLNVLTNMVEKRWHLSRLSGTPGLRTVEGLRREDMPTNCLRRMQAMEAEGLCVRYKD